MNVKMSDKTADRRIDATTDQYDADAVSDNEQFDANITRDSEQTVADPPSVKIQMNYNQSLTTYK